MATEHLHSLNLLSQGDWDAAHQVIKEMNDELACLIHGYLHREEGDISNANYWYSRVSQAVPDNSLEEEFERLYQLSIELETNVTR